MTVVEFWYTMSPEARSTIIAAGVGGLATVIAATIGALVVLGQIGRQARDAIKQNQHNEALKLKLAVYQDIVNLSHKASDAISDLSAFILEFWLALLLARRTEVENNAFAVPSAHPAQLLDKKSLVWRRNAELKGVTETWQIIHQPMDVLRTKIDKALENIDSAFGPYFDAAYHAMPIAAPVDKWAPPSSEALQQLADLGKAVVNALTMLQSDISGFLSEMQTVLIGEMFVMSGVRTGPLNWRRGALRLWVIAAIVWCVAIFSERLLQNKNASWFPNAAQG